MQPLSERQLEVATLLAGGRTKEEVAVLLGIAGRTVKTHADTARWKLGVESTRQFARALVEAGYLSADELVRRAS